MTLHRGEPAVENWKIEQARQALDEFARGSSDGDGNAILKEAIGLHVFCIRRATEPKRDGIEDRVHEGSDAGSVDREHAPGTACMYSRGRLGLCARAIPTWPSCAGSSSAGPRPRSAERHNQRLPYLFCFYASPCLGASVKEFPLIERHVD
jgi:hypothetical protein